MIVNLRLALLHMNRQVGPPYTKIEKLHIPDATTYTLPNGVPVWEVNLGSQDILKIEIVHRAGRSAEKQPLAGRAVSSLLKDGSSGQSSSEIAAEIDYYGASIKTGSNMDFSYTTMYTLTRYADRLIPLLRDMYFMPSFPEDEIEKFKKLNIQKLKEELTKNEVISYRQITEEIFGAEHPYGYNSTESDYQALDRDKLLEHYHSLYGSDNCTIFMSGKISDTIRKDISDSFGFKKQKTVAKEYTPCTAAVSQRKIKILSKKEHQSAIKTGRRLFDKNHTDNAVFFVLNTLFGGYFGSRLMASIREEHGYTYDIHSSMDQMMYDGCFYVSTEAANEYVEPVLKEIYAQMELLREKKVGNAELEMVKNYIMGNFMNVLDGPMNVGSFVKSMVLSGKQPETFNDYVGEILATDAEALRDAAQRYLRTEDMTEVVVTPDEA
jgi:predicted Zn-dependent peptidase